MDRCQVMLTVPLLLLLFVFQTITAAVTIEGVTPGETRQVVVGDSPMFTCAGTSTQTLEWTQLSLYGEVTLDGEPPYIITAVPISGQSKSFLTLENVEELDSGDFTCRDQQNPGDGVTFTLAVGSGGGGGAAPPPPESPPASWKAPEIVRETPGMTTLEMDGVDPPIIKCRGGSYHSQLVFERDGVVLEDGDQDLITTATGANGDVQTILLTPAPIAGVYTCRDMTYPGSDTDSIELVINTNPSAQIEITEPSGTSITVVAGNNFNIKCTAASGITSLQYYRDDILLQDELGGFIITNVDNRQTGETMALLTKEDPQSTDSGLYRCANADNTDQGDSIEVNVRTPGDDDGDDDGDGGSDDGLVVLCPWCGVSALVPSMLVLAFTAGLSLRWGAYGDALF